MGAMPAELNPLGQVERLCSEGHEPIIYLGWDCPVCNPEDGTLPSQLQEIADKLDEAADAVRDAEHELKALRREKQVR